MQDCQGRHRIDNFRALDHPDDLVEGESPNLDELGVVRRAGNSAQALCHVKVRRLVEDRLRSVEAAELEETIGGVAGLLSEFACTAASSLSPGFTAPVGISQRNARET